LGNFFGRSARRKIHIGPRTILVKTLGMLGPDQEGEILNAARAAEQIGKGLNLMWDDLIVEAAEETKPRHKRKGGKRTKAQARST
jgi:hypothetical protein